MVFDKGLIELLPPEKQTPKGRRTIIKTLKRIANTPKDKRTKDEQALLEELGKAYLKLEHIKIKNTWYWKCPVCEKLLGATKVATEGYMKYHWKLYANLQSKGVASKHLMTHDYSLVHHGRDINKIANKGRNN